MNRYFYRGAWTIKVNELFAILYSDYKGKRNFYVEARLVNGEIVYNNPRRVTIPINVQKLVEKEMKDSVDMDVKRFQQWYE